MLKVFHGKKSAGILSMVLVLSLISLSLNGCGSGGGYDAPSTIATLTALITAEVLKGWIDDGKVNSSGYDRVVILDINSQTNYSAGHIPGAHFVNSNDIYQNRKEGPAVDVNMVLDGPHMNALVQKYGIDKNTTVVFTGGSGSCGTATSGAVLSAVRGYWTFRYWGFSKEKLKVLDGINCDYGKKFTMSTTTTPAPTPSTYSIRDNSLLRNDLRASLSEMIDLADGKIANAIPVDFRGPTGSYAGTAGSTTGVFGITGGPTDYTVFEGRVKGAKTLLWSSMLDSANNYKFLSQSDLTSKLTAIGVDSTKTSYVYCRTGVIASSAFFVLDGILGWPVVNYDGSWSQWGQLSATSSKGGRLLSGSKWIVDGSRSENVTYNFDGAKAVELLTNDGMTCSATLKTDSTLINSRGEAADCPNWPESGVDGANQIEDEDADYMSGGAGGGTSGSGGSGGVVRVGC